jgi:prepilin-type N-terminal cleavage/methylation domain-containing protein
MRLLRRSARSGRRANHTREQGFTLIEVVLAMFILLIGMSSILGMLTFGAAMSRTATLRSGAASSIEAIVADLEENLFPLVLLKNGTEAAGEPQEYTDRPVPGYPGLVYSAIAIPNPDDQRVPPLEYRVDVEVSWSTSGKKRGRTFSTILLREVPFGARLRQRFVENIEPQRQ